MPELPEVETIRLTLEPKLLNRTITGVEILLPKMLHLIPVNEFIRQITGKTITQVGRRGKYFLVELTDGQVLAIHLRMTGQLSVEPITEAVAKATYLQLKLDDDNELRFVDQRKFGKVFLFSPEQIPPSIARLGPEPLSPEFTLAIFRKIISGRKLAVKKALLNQEIIAGIGNIYADEALFLAGIHPVRPLDSLDKAEVQKLYQAIKEVLAAGIEHRGTTYRDYRDGEGKSGSHQEYLRVYGRKGLACPVCETPIAKMNFGGRGTHFCPMCQG